MTCPAGSTGSERDGVPSHGTNSVLREARAQSRSTKKLLSGPDAVLEWDCEVGLRLKKQEGWDGEEYEERKYLKSAVH